MHDPTPSPDGAPAARPDALVDPKVHTVLAPDGRATAEVGAGPDARRRVYRSALAARLVDDRVRKLQAEGWIGFAPSGRGAEIAVVAATEALGAQAFVFPAPGDLAAFVHRGLALEALADQLFGNAADPQGGRQMPGQPSARALGLAVVGAPPGTRLSHAVGYAWASRLAGAPTVTGALFSAAEAASHDFHTGLNFAGVSRAPVVFVCRSHPDAPGAAGVAGRAVAYGVRGVRADGGDALAVLDVVGQAAERAAAGLGATLVELVVPPLAPDAEGGPGDPVARFRGHLAAEGLWQDGDEGAAREELGQALEAALQAAAQKPRPATASLFDHVFDRRPAHLRAQLEALEAATER